MRAVHEPTRRPSPAAGFTLVELLVVIGLIVLLLAVGMPAVSAIVGSGKTENARNSIEAAVKAARAFATADAPVSGGSGGGYKGTAAVFIEDPQQGTEIHVVRHTSYTPHTPPKPVYVDLTNANVVELDDQVGLAAITRGTDGLVLVPPPFAVRFDRHGVLISRRSSTADQDGVYYDVNDDDAITQSSEGLHTVIGVFVFSRADLIEAHGSDLTAEADSSDPKRDWIRNNGEALLFNRYSGTLAREQ